MNWFELEFYARQRQGELLKAAERARAARSARRAIPSSEARARCLADVAALAEALARHTGALDAKGVRRPRRGVWSLIRRLTRRQRSVA